jgi:UDP-N-acetylmuramoylalanine--D-glutamate ligase
MKKNNNKKDINKKNINKNNIKEFLRSKKILVMGLGKTGISVINKLSGIARSIKAIDVNPYLDIEDEFEKVKKSDDFNLEVILDEKINENERVLESIELIIISPGISNDIPIIKKADKLGIPIWSEIELAWTMLSSKEKINTIAVTGTNGKTTVVTLIEKILADCGKKAVVCGNIGNPLINTLDPCEDSGIIRVIEISSFQLERVTSFKPHVGIILNITNDHIDRHFSMDSYADLKFKLFLNMDSKDYGVFNINDEFINKKLAGNNYFKSTGLNIISFSLDSGKNADIFYKNNEISYKIGLLNGVIDISDILLKGEHNVSNIIASVAASKIFGVEDTSLTNTIRSFKTLEHRIEYIGTVNRIKCFNDSKATNPDATIKALQSFNKEVTLILGGKDKKMDFEQLLLFFDEKVLNLILIGETKYKIFNILKKHKSKNYKVYLCNSFEEAVDKGFEVTESGKVLLLSPACASFDMFKDYKDRGKKFKNLILKRRAG